MALDYILERLRLCLNLVTSGLKHVLALPLPSLLLLTPYTGGGGGGGSAGPSAISKTLASMNVKFCRY